jgi:putative two-component system response regulator
METKLQEVDVTTARILVVDDQQSNVTLMERLLELGGYHSVWVTTDPHEVEELYEEHQHDVLLLDVRMPGMTGLELVSRIRSEHGSHRPGILVITAQSDRETRISALTAGANDFLTKPFDSEELLARVENLAYLQLAQRRLEHTNHYLEEAIEQRTRELEDTQLEVVKRLGLAAEFRDNETGCHIMRMSEIVVILAEALGYSGRECSLLRNASQMHDVGKIGIPDEILLKPGALTAEERKSMEQHTIIGARLLGGNSSRLLQQAEEIALTHHEHWDGSGYPNGLQGTEIPLSGRIAAVADVFDALTSDRPYKQAWPVEDAVELIRSQRGRQFDPQVVDAFMAHLEPILEVKELYTEEDGTGCYHA